jgi:hypothetical protein
MSFSMEVHHPGIHMPPADEAGGHCYAARLNAGWAIRRPVKTRCRAQRCQRPAGANRAVRNARTKSGMAPSKSLCPRTMRTSASSGFFSRARCANEEACACACAHHCGATKAAGKRKRCDRPARQGLDVEASVANAERSSARGRRGFLRTTPWGLYLLTAASPPLAIC